MIIKLDFSHDGYKRDNLAFYLLLINVNQVAPHLALVLGNNYFSLSVKGISNAVSFDSKLESMKRKKLPLVLFKLQKNVPEDGLFRIITYHFSKLSPLKGDGITCLHPIKASLEEIYKFESGAEVVADLLLELEKLSIIDSVESINLKEDIFTLKPYQLEDVQRQIAQKLI
ncbi:MAG: hypothetical protein WED33_02335 [Bacteroidia bacterium]